MATDTVEQLREKTPRQMSAVGTAPGSVDSLPVRIAPRWKDQHHAQGVSHRVSS